MTLEAGSEAAGTTPGAVLAGARERMGLSVADVAGQMRISTRQVEAIEADRYQELPGAVFVRGFVRNYARLLKIDPVPLLHQLEPALGQGAPLRSHEIAGALPVPARRTRAVRWLGLLAALVAGILGIGVYEYIRERSQTGVANPPVAQPQKSEARAAASGAAEVAPGAIEVKPAVDPSVEAQPAASADLPPAASAAAVGTSGVRIGMAFLQSSWVEIRDGEGTVVFSGTATAGSTREWEGKPPVSVLVGNASGVRITYNDRPFDVTPHANRNIARFTLE